MDLRSPIRSVIPSVQGEVLAVLARTDQPLSGRRVAELTGGLVSQKGTNLALRALVEAGIVTADDHPPAKLYSLNRRHLAAPAIEGLVSLRERLIEAMRAHLAGWEVPPWGAWMFGSSARGDGDASSDIDVLIVRPEAIDAHEPVWIDQIDAFAVDVTDWSGNSCAVVEYGEAEFGELMEQDDRLARGIRADGIALTDRRLPRQMRVTSLR